MTKSNYYRTIDRTGQIAPKVKPRNRKSLHGQRNDLTISHELCVCCFFIWFAYGLLPIFNYLIIFYVIVRFNICLYWNSKKKILAFLLVMLKRFGGAIVFASFNQHSVDRWEWPARLWDWQRRQHRWTGQHFSGNGGSLSSAHLQAKQSIPFFSGSDKRRIRRYGQCRRRLWFRPAQSIRHHGKQLICNNVTKMKS